MSCCAWVRVILDCGGQGLNFFGLGLVGSSKGSDLCRDCRDILLQGGTAGCHRGLYLGRSVFYVVVIVI